MLQLDVLEDLFALELPPRIFDFSTGYGAHKGRFGNYSELETNVLVLPRTTRTAVIFHSYKLADGISRLAGQLLQRFALKDRLKKLARRVSIR